MPSNVEVNPKNDGIEQCKTVTLRSGKQLEEQSAESPNKVPKNEEKSGENKGEEKKVDEEPIAKDKTKKQSVVVPAVPFPQRFQKQKLDKQFSKFLEVFKKFQINILFPDALDQMPSFLKFMKDILSRKRKLGEFEIMALTK